MLESPQTIRGACRRAFRPAPSASSANVAIACAGQHRIAPGTPLASPALPAFARASSWSDPRSDIQPAAAACQLARINGPSRRAQPLHAIHLRPAHGPGLADRASPSGASQPHADPLLLAENHAEDHFINWQQDPFGNYLARLVFPEKTREFKVEVDLVADMATINPFDFFLDEAAGDWPFNYDAELREELAPYLKASEPGPLLAGYIRGLKIEAKTSLDFIWALNQQLQHDIGYLIRMEPGVQTPEETLKTRSGSCRDSGWLLVHILRHYGLAARFVSGYLIQLKADMKSLDGPSGTEHDFTDLHAWAEVYLPGAGWIGLDPTSGLFAGEGHIPLAATPSPQSAAPVTGMHDEAEVAFSHEMQVTRILECPRVTLPYTEEQWQAIATPATRSTGVCAKAMCACPWAANRPSSPSTMWMARNGTPRPLAPISGAMRRP